jgi:tRNA (guanine37-N1)-methyltransferase
MKIDILTLFPEVFPGPLGSSIVGRAVKKGLVEINALDTRSKARDARGTVDDKPYGGGPGMLMMAEPLVDAIEEIKTEDTVVILTSPRGKVFNQQIARELSNKKHLVIVCGHYEGVDQRAIDLAVDVEISLGDFVLSSGILPAMVISDAVVRLLPGALGDDESSEDESHTNYLLEYPQYTRPAEYRGLKVPEVLLNGDHGKVREYRRREMERLTRERRPDLWEKYLSQTKGV